MNKNNKTFLAISFGGGFTSPNIPIATFYQDGNELNFVLDTGSDDNVVDREALSKIQHEKIEHSGTLSGIGGTAQVEACAIKFTYGGEEFKEKFLISDTLNDAFSKIRAAHAIPLHGMIGSKFLRKNNLVLDFTNMIAYNQN